MNESDLEVAEERQASPGLRDLGARAVITLLGPNEEATLPRFLPYAPRFNLRPPRKGLPIWALPFLSAGLALLMVLPIAAVVRFLTDSTLIDITETRRKTELRLKEDAQYDAAEKRLALVESEKSALDQVTSGGPRWSILLDRIRAQLPPGVRLTLIQADAKGKVAIEGECTDIRALATFMLFLRAYRDNQGRNFFNRPKLLYSERAKGPASQAKVYVFEMTMSVPAATLVDLGEATEQDARGSAETGGGSEPR
ncbi:MAG: PilN domain-containing protein [Candidatus Sericytochromatia bacterium]|uniref:PilN domain-containing protein n=1 Tax=Candidatus Tanganyikabacteria bacterium TaxID=2961651 RepID=A0A938BM08_9BACT|nr:PilN domain-containing protein [Candidatus Tanganyikabacteria bacterium]